MNAKDAHIEINGKSFRIDAWNYETGLDWVSEGCEVDGTPTYVPRHNAPRFTINIVPLNAGEAYAALMETLK